MAFPGRGGYYLPKRHRKTGGAVESKTLRRPYNGNSCNHNTLFAVVGNLMAANLLG
jgi:hypothetical protein